MREINMCPILLASGYDTYSPSGRKYLFDGKKIDCNLDFSFYGEDSTDNLVSNMQNLSISGAQEKYSAVLDGHKIRLANKNEQGTYILKPAPADKIKDRKEIPANEHLTMQIANQAYGIDTAKNGLCFDSNGDVVYITKRYDVTGERKLNQEDFASLTGHTLEKDGGNFKYDGSYSDIANCIKKEISAWMVAMEQFFKLTVFNYIFGNGDAHLKNFSILNTGTENILAPAYDLINTKMHINGDDIGLANGFAQDFCKSDNYEKTGHPCRDDFFRFGTQIGLQSKRVEVILDKFSSFDPKVYSLIYNSFLSTDKHKRNYIRIIEENQKRFVRN